MLERLQKILSARGVASRRKAEEYITQGLVKVNGTVATLGQKADPEVDQIEVDGKVMQARQEMLYYVMNKPRGVVTTNVDVSGFEFRVSSTPQLATPFGSAQGKLHPKPVPTVRDLLPPNLRGKVYPVGRLDKDSEGLLLLTNDGVLAYRLTHPKFDHEKEYEVTVTHVIKDGQLRKLEEGMTISGEKTKPTRILRLGESSFRIVLTEGKNRQIRRMCQKVGAPVATLKRVRIMTLKDSGLKSGMLRPLTTTERTALLAAVGI
ncbi:MAG TPA: pseudouridine synthase [Candidatus Peribacteraceae bacterium]|nr:pseudouridine synthase [Candidatus Peribacteraceae bacterium]